VVRVGNTARRRPAARAGFVHQFLDFFQPVRQIKIIIPNGP